MAPSACSLNKADLGSQLARYRVVGTRAALLERTRRRLVMRVDDTVSDSAVEGLIAVERRCCPFFGLQWDQHERFLSISVSSSEEETALDAIAEALGLRREGSRRRYLTSDGQG